MKLNPAIAFLGIALFLSSSRLAGEDKPSALSRRDIEQIVREYILQHPEVLIESVRAFQERERITQQQRSREAVLSKSRELLEDPLRQCQESPMPESPSCNSLTTVAAIAAG